MKRLFLLLSVLTILLPAAPVRAGYYLGLGLGAQTDNDVPAPALTPAHPVATVRESESDTGTAYSLSIGHRWTAWYVELAFDFLDETGRDDVHEGEDPASNFDSFAVSEETVRTVALKLGRFFALTESLSFYGEAGVHRYEQEVEHRLVTTTTPKDPLGSPSSTFMSETHSRKDTDAVYGAGVALTRSDVTMKLGVLHYGGVDRTAFLFSAMLPF
ncbi:MAG TPA: outer membrane beta-barrel protein [Burkholderiales bacterium]